MPFDALDTVGVVMMEATPLPANARTEVLGGGKYFQWRWGRNKRQSSYGGKFHLLPKHRQLNYLARTGKENGDE
ncbi:MAG: hypothetical protein ACKN9T_18255 [Candidatus Methylumidiphilus sp.]